MCSSSYILGLFVFLLAISPNNCLFYETILNRAVVQVIGGVILFFRLKVTLFLILYKTQEPLPERIVTQGKFLILDFLVQHINNYE